MIIALVAGVPSCAHYARRAWSLGFEVVEVFAAGLMLGAVFGGAILVVIVGRALDANAAALAAVHRAMGRSPPSGEP